MRNKSRLGCRRGTVARWCGAVTIATRLVAARAEWAACCALAVSAPRLTYAQLGSGWIETNFTKSIHLDDENGLETFSWAPYKAVGSGTTCADYTFDAAADTETFRLFDSRTNRAEIRLHNEYSTGVKQFQGYVTFSGPLKDESLFQIFGSSSGATELMLRGFAANGGEIRVYGGDVLASHIYGVEQRINVIHQQEDSGNQILVYLNGQLAWKGADDEPVTNYWKYGCYGTVHNNVPAVVQWRDVQTFTDGLLPGAYHDAYEAENATIHGGAVAANSGGFSGTGFIDLQNPSGDSITWTINAQKAGLYDLGIRYALQSGNRPLQIELNGKIINPQLSFPATGGWNTWAYATIPMQMLQPGVNTIKATDIGSSGANIDHLMVSALEAEDATRSGAAVSDANTGFTGDGYADFTNASGDYVQWTFDVPQAGKYDLNFRYALDSGNRPLQVQINGQVVASSFNFISSGGWSNWLYDTLAAQNLTAGTNTVRLSAIGFSGANIDSLLLTPVPEPTSIMLVSIGAISLFYCGRKLTRQRR